METTKKATKGKNKLAKKAPRGKPFPKGVSGNPKGRPRKTEADREREAKKKEAEKKEFDAICVLTEALPHSIEVVIALMDDPDTNPSVKLKILEMLMDRIFGKPYQAVQIEQSKPLEYTYTIVSDEKDGDDYGV